MDIESQALLRNGDRYAIRFFIVQTRSIASSNLRPSSNMRESARSEVRNNAIESQARIDRTVLALYGA